MITPKVCQGSVEQFLRQWKEGIPGSHFSKGFVSQYMLRGCEFRVEGVDSSDQIPESYIKACARGLEYSQDAVKKFDLAFVVVEEKHRLLQNNDPYLVTKAQLMGREIPVQVIEQETINKSLPANIPFILNNLALACYAKLGGTPWSLKSSRGQGITHELVIGLGSASLASSRYEEKERFVGITTLFNYDGVYLLSNVSQEVAYAQYPEALQTTLLESIQHVSIKKGWQRGDKVRLIFHTFKPLKYTEAEAIKKVVTEKLSDYTVEFAFLTVTQYTTWRVYSPGFPGKKTTYGGVRGKDVPPRGTTVIFGKRKALLSMIGAPELKTADQGCPAPLELTLHGASTFEDIEYLTRQVFEFSYMSWKTFNLGATPVTIDYSDQIAKLLGRLRRVRNWNSDVLQSGTLKSSLWFL